jgi:hypothetical protein
MWSSCVEWQPEMPYRNDRDHVVAWLLSALPIPCGLVIAMLNERFTSRAWRFAAGIPGGYAMWGGVLLVLGAVMLISLALTHFHNSDQGIVAFITATIGVGAWWILLGGMFLYTAIRDPLANPLGGVVWLWLGVLHWVWARYERRRL